MITRERNHIMKNTPITKRLRRTRKLPVRRNAANASWSLHFDRDGTEDIAVIRDADGVDLVISRHFWLPEPGDPVPATLAAIWQMIAAPKLLRALDYLLEQTVDMDLKYGITLSEGERDARAVALAAFAEATSGPPSAKTTGRKL
jgi:hypothetical protein